MSLELIKWLAVTAYAVGWMLSIPGSLQRWMLDWECPTCGGWSCYARSHAKDVRRGSYRDRSGRDVAIAILRAAAWLPRLLVVIARGVLRLSGCGVVSVVNRATPLTAPEAERRATLQAERIAEQQAEIDRLSKQITEEASTDAH